MNASANNKRIAKNTLFLYLRMLFVMGVSLYTVRAVLDILGVVDYGIYNVVGGVVTMFTFMNRTLSTSSQRYFSIELARDDKERLNKWFCLNITAFLSIGMLLVLLLETVGLWFLNNKMMIPADRLTAANVVYQLSIVSFVFHIVSIPYLALIIAHEKMNVFAYVGIVEALGRLAIVFILMMLTYDKLIIYGILILLLSIGTAMSYIVYCWRNYSESKYRWYWNTAEVIELLGFSGWHFLGTFSTTCRGQGINILLNMFFNPAVNAARAVAFQLHGATQQLVGNFFTAVKPQIYKSYAANQFEDLYKLINRSTLICAFLISLLVFPVIANTELILGIWLKEVPEYAVIFTQLVLINGLVDSVDGPTVASALATGKIRRYMLIVSGIILANIPISYIALLFGAEPWITMCVSILLSITSVLVRGFLLRSMIGFPYKRYLVVVGKTAVVSMALFVLCRFFIYNLAQNIIQVILWSIIVVFCVLILYISALSKNDRHFAIKYIQTKLLNKKIKNKV